MNPQTEERLFLDYGEFFPNRADPSRSSMNWGFTCGEGWARLVEAPLWYAKGEVKEWQRKRHLKERLVQEGIYKPEGDHAWLEKAIVNHPAPPFQDLEVTQVKEKFGELRFYHQGGATWEFMAIVDAVCWLSTVTCESCGRPAALQVASTLRFTWCDECSSREVPRHD